MSLFYVLTLVVPPWLPKPEVYDTCPSKIRFPFSRKPKSTTYPATPPDPIAVALSLPIPPNICEEKEAKTIINFLEHTHKT